MPITAPHTPMHAAAKAQPAMQQLQHLPKSNPMAARLISVVAVGGVLYAVGSYVKTQLTTESSTMDRIFSQQNTAEVEAHRRKQLLVESYGDPRNSLINILGWAK